jgi:hypothetical protein
MSADRDATPITHPYDFGPATSVNLAVSALRENGFVILRKVLDRELLARKLREAQVEFERLDAIRERLSEEDRRSLDRMEMPVPEPETGLRVQPDNYQLLNHPLIREVIFRYQGAFLWHYPPQVRRQNPRVESALLPYHQDVAYSRGRYDRFVVCWVPLTACGNTAPGLEFLVGRIDEDLQHEAAGAWEAGINGATIESLRATLPSHAPILETGDVILFGEHTLHRTYFHPEMQDVRLNFDFRAPSLSGLHPGVRDTRRFVEPEGLEFV